MAKSVGVYLTKGVLDIFDSMEKLGIKKVNKIINDIKVIYSDAPNYQEIIQLGKDKVTLNTLKEILGKKASDKDIEDFIKVFRNINGGNAIKNADMLKDDAAKREKRYNVVKNQGPNKKILKFTDDFWMMLDKVDDEVSLALFEIGHNPDIDNKLDIERVDVSESEYYFDVYYYSGKKGTIKAGEFIRAYLGNKIDKDQIYEFVRQYNRLLSGMGEFEELEVPPFKYNPKDVRTTFISMVTETYPHGHEEGVLKYLPMDVLKADQFGNLYTVIGDSDTMFTSHLDTASRNKSKIRLISKMKDGDEFLSSDGTTILGADDKAGVAILLYMMAHNIPGVYYFFLGEERGGIGSGKVADVFDAFTFLKNIKKVVSFDRRNYYSVITEQYGVESCSDTFGESLCKELNKSGLKMNLDPTGVFTDSANFIDYVPECTNVSVGYFNEHTHEEIQNITFLEKLAKACVAVDWDKLAVTKKIGFDQAILDKWADLLKDVKDTAYYNDLGVKGLDGKIVIELEFDDSSLKHAYDDLSYLEAIFLIHKCNPDIKFDGNIIKIKIS